MNDPKIDPLDSDHLTRLNTALNKRVQELLVRIELQERVIDNLIRQVSELRDRATSIEIWGEYSAEPAPPKTPADPPTPAPPKHTP